MFLPTASEMPAGVGSCLNKLEFVFNIESDCAMRMHFQGAGGCALSPSVSRTRIGRDERARRPASTCTRTFQSIMKRTSPGSPDSNLDRARGRNLQAGRKETYAPSLASRSAPACAMRINPDVDVAAKYFSQRTAPYSPELGCIRPGLNGLRGNF